MRAVPTPEVRAAAPSIRSDFAWTLAGNVVFAGCYRMTNADITDLYSRVSVGNKVVVRQRPTL